MSAPYGQGYYGQQPYGQSYGYGSGPQMPMPNQYGQGYYQPPPSNYYQQPQDQKVDKPQNSSSSKPSNNDGEYKSKIEFNDKPKYQDLWATFVYLAVVAVTVVIAVITIPNMDLNRVSDTFKRSGKSSRPSKYNNNYYYKRDDDNKDLDTKTVLMLLGAGLGSSTILTVLYMMLVQKFTGKMIKGTLILSILLEIVYAVILFLANPIIGFIMLIFAGLYALCYFFWRKRIPFAKVMLKTVTSVTKKFPATIFIGFLGCIFAIVWYGFIGLTLIAAMGSDKAQENPVVGYVMYIFLIFSFFYTSQVVNNTVHVTISGVFATFYFRGATEPGTNEIEVDVKNPTISSLKRAMTTSFGSICYGSLIIAAVSTLRVLANNVKHDAADDGDTLLCIIACCIECILSCIEDGIEYFNVYAYTEVAIYGKSYCQAAKDTWTLCKARGIEALINDNLIGNVLVIGALAVGCLAGTVTFFVGNIFDVELVANIIFTVIALFIGIMVFSVVAQVINSGVATTFVCLCEDPDALRQTKPELWEKVRDTYPSIVY